MGTIEYYSDVRLTLWCLKSVATQLTIQQSIVVDSRGFPWQFPLQNDSTVKPVYNDHL